ncbi:Rv3654c family TadE-like protein [Kribbella sp. NPDC051718]|uniref:Rv3654c family TadE-like protein n=1 Tax=Kribbella sp. NPDC051718 TaxID=3155168 RepID=UPI00342EB071
MTDRTDRGSATLLSLGIAAVLLGASMMGVLWSAVSIGHHRADTAADLAALSAAQAHQSTPDHACTTATRIANTQGATLKYCHADGDTVTVAVTVRLHLGALSMPLLTSEARAGPIGGGGAGPIGGGDWPGDG